MLLNLAPDELSMLNALAAPIDDARRQEFLGAVERAIELQRPPPLGLAWCTELAELRSGIISIRPSTPAPDG